MKAKAQIQPINKLMGFLCAFTCKENIVLLKGGLKVGFTDEDKQSAFNWDIPDLLLDKSYFDFDEVAVKRFGKNPQNDSPYRALELQVLVRALIVGYTTASTAMFVIPLPNSYLKNAQSEVSYVFACRGRSMNTVDLRRFKLDLDDVHFKTACLTKDELKEKRFAPYRDNAVGFNHFLAANHLPFDQQAFEKEKL